MIGTHCLCIAPLFIPLVSYSQLKCHPVSPCSNFPVARAAPVPGQQPKLFKHHLWQSILAHVSPCSDVSSVFLDKEMTLLMKHLLPRPKM